VVHVVAFTDLTAASVTPPVVSDDAITTSSVVVIASVGCLVSRLRADGVKKLPGVHFIPRIRAGVTAVCPASPGVASEPRTIHTATAAASASRIVTMTWPNRRQWV
jgi:hypothetical protein